MAVPLLSKKIVKKYVNKFKRPQSDRKAFVKGKKVIVLSNLKLRNMRGVKSSGMLMAALGAKHENVQLLFPIEEAAPGERIWFGSEDEKENQLAAATPNQLGKHKVAQAYALSS